jgi:sulfur carrier protein
MTIVLNGEAREAAPGATVMALLETLRLGPARVAVEVNGAILPRGDFGRCTLRENDRVEIVQFVGGG